MDLLDFNTKKNKPMTVNLWNDKIKDYGFVMFYNTTIKNYTNVWGFMIEG